MNSRREQMLREMGLTPVWRLRTPPSPQSSPTAPLPQLREERASSAFADQPGATIHESRAADEAPLVNDRRASIMCLEWSELKSAVAACQACALHARRKNTVFGVGDEKAEWVFVGEGPGAEEDALGDPFVGQAGRLLDNMLAAIRLRRDRNVYICNVVKCRPPGNRNPEPDEMQKCEPYLQRQIELIRPKLIIALGRIAAQNLLVRDASIASLRGRVHEYKGVPLIVTYHPAYLLRSLPDKAKAWEDLCFAVSTMQRLQSGATGPI